jgi:type IV pilus assembly protein PilA
MKKNQKGFTMIELMIVIAIIAILAAIAIPQFAAYKVRSCNAAALADLKNMMTSEVAFNIDNGGYGMTNEVITTESGNLIIQSTSGINSLDIVVSSGNSIYVQIDQTDQSCIIVSKHKNGNITYGYDSDINIIYENEKPATFGSTTYTFLKSDVPESTFGVNNLASPWKPK